MSEENLPVLPYGGTSGWSGSDTSKDRAEESDGSGRTAHIQKTALSWLRNKEREGTTWSELSSVTGWHHGTTSGVLSTLHKAGRICRLTETVGRRKIYVLPEYVHGRPTEPYGRKKILLSDEEKALLVWADFVEATKGPEEEISVPVSYIASFAKALRAQH